MSGSPFNCERADAPTVFVSVTFGVVLRSVYCRVPSRTTDRVGTVRVVVSEVTKGTGAAWVRDALGAPVFTGSTYTFTESQQLMFRLRALGKEFGSDFADKIVMKGAKRIDNWVVRAHFRIKVNADGTVQAFMIKSTADSTCMG